ncbi:hypothetical protein SAMN05216584_10345 [Selenomonas sp. WCT3]|uniref:glycosyltransferase n=1 Tax=Selenomonas sp. WCT3 TaxID=3158785 RepID=UPI00088E2A39|nr:hypothetical protein SAMN05216584_10345 [Selenomonas ruminantium]
MISVIMPCFREDETVLRKAIESILNQTYSDFELIIILDDPKNELLYRTVSEYRENDKRIRFYINKKNYGITKTLNRALSFAVGDYIARMDADDISKVTRLEKQLNFIEKHNLDLIGCDYEVIDNDGNFLYVNHNPITDKKIKSVLQYRNCIAHPTYFARRHVFKILKGYVEIEACEDYHFLLRAVMHNFRLGNLPDVGLSYRLSQNGISRKKEVKQEVIADYLRNNLDNIVDMNNDVVNRYLESDLGVYNIEQMNEYIYYRNRIKNGNYFNVMRIINNKYAKLYLQNVIKDKLFSCAAM